MRRIWKQLHRRPPGCAASLALNPDWNFSYPNIRMQLIANTCGRIHPADEPSLSPLNRGFLYGDSIYEVWRTWGNCVFAFEYHWERLEASANSLAMKLPLDRAQCLRALSDTAAEFRRRNDWSGDCYLRLQVSRGAGPIGLDPRLADAPVWVMIVQPLPLLDPRVLEQGLVLHLAEGIRRNAPDALNPAWKSGNYLNNVMALHEAKQAGADEVLLLNQAGAITEAAVCNVFFVMDDAVVTPPVESGILHGVTRRILLEQGQRLAGMPVEVMTVTPADLDRARECFLCSTTKDLQPVGRIGTRQFKVGPNTVTSRMKAAFQELYRNEAANSPWRL
jgi:branched-chain amino acid aminotransferase